MGFDLTPASLFFGILFGAWGLMAVQIGRKRGDARPVILGVALMGLTFVVGSTWWSWPLAILMSIGCWWPKI